MAPLEKTRLIWKLYAVGFLAIMVGMSGCFSTSKDHAWLQFVGWAAMTFIGWFLMVIRVPNTYPQKLFILDWYNMVIPLWLALLFAGLIIVIPYGGGVGYRASLALLVAVGVLVSSVAAEILVKVAARIGHKIASKQITD